MHSHILPELDDGSKSVETSLQLIELLRKQNVKNISLTPHYYSNEESIEDFVVKREKSVQKLIPQLPEDVNVSVGAEVYITRYLFNNKDLSELTYGDSRYILCEFGFSSRFSDHTMEHFYRLQNNYGLTPVLTHIERYPNLMKNRRLIESLLNEGIIIQTNVESVCDQRFRRKLLKFLKLGYIEVLGTDCHSFVRGNPLNYTQALDIIRKKCGQECIDNIVKTSDMIFSPYPKQKNDLFNINF